MLYTPSYVHRSTLSSCLPCALIESPLPWLYKCLIQVSNPGLSCARSSASSPRSQAVTPWHAVFGAPFNPFISNHESLLLATTALSVERTLEPDAPGPDHGYACVRGLREVRLRRPIVWDSSLLDCVGTFGFMRGRGDTSRIPL